MLCYHCMREKGDADVCPYCHAQGTVLSQPHHLRPGTVIGNRYTLGRVLGEGGFGITYIGKSNVLDIVTAIKEYYPCGYCNRNTTAGAAVTVTDTERKAFYEQGRSRFLKEAKTLARFRNEPGIVDVIDFIEENNTAYIVMEYLDGVNLRDYLKKHGTVSPEEAVRMLMPMMQALEKVHAAGVIHRDISPDNIMILSDGTVKLMDFGAARDYDGDNRSMSVMLKKGYAPEEQYRRGGEQGPWTDVYGICATIYRMITGAAPVESMDRVYRDTLKAPSACGVRISPAMEKAILGGLAIYKDNRCPDMGTLIGLFTNALNTGYPDSGVTVPLGGYPDPNATVIANDATRAPQNVRRDPNQTMAAEATYIPPAQQGYRQPPQPPYPPRQAYPAQPYPPQPQQKSGSKGVIVAVICIAAAVLIAAVVLIVVLLNRDGSSTGGNVVSNNGITSGETTGDTATGTSDDLMPDLVGMTKQDAIDELADRNLVVTQFVETDSDTQSPGTVLNQVPKKGTAVTSDTKITLYIVKPKSTEKPTEKPTSAPSPTQAADSGSSQGTYLYCTADTYVTVHTSANTSSSAVCKIWRGQAAKYLSKSGNYYYVDFGGVKGYAYASYLSYNASEIPYKNSSVIYVNSNVTSEGLALRESPNVNSPKLAAIPAGASMEFQNRCGNNNETKGSYHVQWAYVKYGNQYGYVYDYYVHD